MIDRLRLAELLDGVEPQNFEEKEWIENWYKISEESQRKTEEYYKRLQLANVEIELLFRKYAPKEYWSDGFYNSDEFKQIEKEVEERVTEEILNFPKFLSHYHTAIYFRRRKQQIIRKEYGHKWYDIVNLVPEEFWEEKHSIKRKYGLKV